MNNPAPATMASWDEVHTVRQRWKQKRMYLVREAPSEPQGLDPRAAKQPGVVVGDRSSRRRRSRQAGQAGGGQEEKSLGYCAVVRAVRKKVSPWIRLVRRRRGGVIGGRAA